MAVLEVAVPPALSSYGRRRPCHEPLLRGMLVHLRRRMLEFQYGAEFHYGADVHTCPAAGMMAPGIVAGTLDEVSEELWMILEAGLLAFAKGASVEQGRLEHLPGRSVRGTNCHDNHFQLEDQLRTGAAGRGC